MLTDITRRHIDLTYQRLQELNKSLSEQDRENNKKLKFCLSIVENMRDSGVSRMDKLMDLLSSNILNKLKR